jgi:multidrug efflux pump subunit AcrA (membrane-fusion protein)
MKKMIIRMYNATMNRWAFLLIVVSCVTFMACSQKEQASKASIVSVKTIEVTANSRIIGKSYVGTIEEEDGANVSFGVLGNVVRVMVEEGQFVRKGQAMAEVDGHTVRNAHDITTASC